MRRCEIPTQRDTMAESGSGRNAKGDCYAHQSAWKEKGRSQGACKIALIAELEDERAVRITLRRDPAH